MLTAAPAGTAIMAATNSESIRESRIGSLCKSLRFVARSGGQRSRRVLGEEGADVSLVHAAIVVGEVVIIAGRTLRRRRQIEAGHLEQDGETITISLRFAQVNRVRPVHEGGGGFEQDAFADDDA